VAQVLPLVVGAGFGSSLAQAPLCQLDVGQIQCSSEREEMYQRAAHPWSLVLRLTLVLPLPAGCSSVSLEPSGFLEIFSEIVADDLCCQYDGFYSEVFSLALDDLLCPEPSLLPDLFSSSLPTSSSSASCQCASLLAQVAVCSSLASSRKELLERNPCWSCSSQMSASLPLDLPLHSPPSIGTNPTWSSEEHVVNCSLRAVCTVDPTTLAPTAPAASTAASFRSLSSPHQLLVLLLLPHCQSSLWFSLSISFTR